MPGIAPDLAQAGNPTNLIEPGGNPVTGPFSDIFGVAIVNGVFFLALSSDNEVTEPFSPVGTIFAVETGAGPYNASALMESLGPPLVLNLERGKDLLS